MVMLSFDLVYLRALCSAADLVYFTFFIMHILIVDLIITYLSTEANGESLQIAFFCFVIRLLGSCSYR